MRRRYGVIVLLVVLVLLLGARQVMGRPFARTILLGGAPLAVAIDARLEHAFILNGAGGTISMLNARTGDLAGTVEAGLGAHALAVDEVSDRVFVANEAEGSVSVIDARSDALMRTVLLGGSPGMIAIDGSAGRVFVTTSDPGAAIVVLDGRTGTAMGRIHLDETPTTLAVDPVAHRLFVASAGMVHVFNTLHGTLVRTASVGIYPLSISVDSRNGRTFLINGGDSTVSVLQSRSGMLLRTLPLRGYPIASAVDERRGTIFVASTDNLPGMSSAGSIAVLGAGDGRQIAMFPVAGSVIDLWVDSRDGRLLVDQGSDVLVLDEQSGVPVRAMPTNGVRVAGTDSLAIDERNGRALAVNTYVLPADPNPLLQVLHHWLSWLPRPIHIAPGSVTLWDAGQ